MSQWAADPQKSASPLAWKSSRSSTCERCTQGWPQSKDGPNPTKMEKVAKLRTFALEIPTVSSGKSASPHLQHANTHQSDVYAAIRALPIISLELNGNSAQYRHHVPAASRSILPITGGKRPNSIVIKLPKQWCLYSRRSHVITVSKVEAYCDQSETLRRNV